MMDILADELKHETDFRPGDIQFLHNHVIVHGRTQYEDWPEEHRKRHLLRLWLATPGGRPLPKAVLERYVGLKPGQRPAGIVVENMDLNNAPDAGIAFIRLSPGVLGGARSGRENSTDISASCRFLKPIPAEYSTQALRQVINVPQI